MPTECDRIERIRRVLEEREEDPELFSPEFRNHSPFNFAARRASKSPGRVHLKDTFSDFTISVLSAVETSDKVVVRWRLRGTWSGPLPFSTVRPSGQKIDVTGVNIYTFIGSKIVENHGEVDIASFHDQACESVGKGVERVNPAECAKMLQALARPIATRGQ